jgi:hypothetical protein
MWFLESMQGLLLLDGLLGAMTSLQKAKYFVSLVFPSFLI